MKKKTIFLMITMMMLWGVGWLVTANAATIVPTATLPMPDPGFIANVPDPTAPAELREAILVDGVPVAFKYDDFWSYSAKMLDAVQDAGYLPLSFGEYQFATGTGGLDALLYTGATGQNNQNIGPSGTVDLEDPVLDKGGSRTTFSGWWGQDDQDNDPSTVENNKGPVTVGQILDYLHEFDPDNNIPVFYLDLNQTGSEPSFLFSARVALKDSTGAIVHEWALDAETQAGDGLFDIDEKALAAGEISFTGFSGTEYTVNHNLGSGSPDFIGIAPTMDLGLFNRDLLFVTEFHMEGLNDGFEEIFLTGGITTSTTVIPEPGTMVLLGIGLLGLAGVFRKNHNKSMTNE
jgi:hypothetical protein